MFGIFALIVVIIGVVLFVASLAMKAPQNTGYNYSNPKKAVRIGGAVAVGVGILFLGFASFTTVDAGEVVVPVQFGEVQTPLTKQGINFKSPFAGTIAMPTRTVELTFEGTATQNEDGGENNLGQINALSAEGAQVSVDVTALYHIDPTETAKVYSTVGTAWEEVLVLPRIRNVVRDCLPNYTFEDARTTLRGEASACMLDKLQAALAPRGIVIEDVLLRDMRASAELQDAIDAKLEAQTNEQRAVFEQREAVVRAETARITAKGVADARREQAIGEAAAIRLEAEAQAEANTAIAASLTPELLQLRIYEQLGDKTVVITDGATAPLPILPLG